MITRTMAVLAALHRSQCYTFETAGSMLKLNELATMVHVSSLKVLAAVAIKPLLCHGMLAAGPTPFTFSVQIVKPS